MTVTQERRLGIIESKADLDESIEARCQRLSPEARRERMEALCPGIVGDAGAQLSWLESLKDRCPGLVERIDALIVETRRATDWEAFHGPWNQYLDAQVARMGVMA